MISSFFVLPCYLIRFAVETEQTLEQKFYWGYYYFHYLLKYLIFVQTNPDMGRYVSGSHIFRALIKAFLPWRSINLGMKPIKIPQKFFSVMTSRLGRDKAKTRRPSKKKDEFFIKIYVVLRRIWPPRFKVCNFANFFHHFLFRCWGYFKKKKLVQTYFFTNVVGSTTTTFNIPKKLPQIKGKIMILNKFSFLKNEKWG